MKQISALAFAALLCATPVAAQEQQEDGADLMERGMELLLDGLREEMSPALNQMRQLAEEYGPALFSFLDEMGPAFAEMLEEVRDWTAYHPPEMLPNGDILIRKKIRPRPEPEAEPEDAPELDPPTQGQTDI
jgi:hypothetical protein